MPADNLEIFKKVIFRLPELEKTVKLMLATSILYGALLFVLLSEGLGLFYDPIPVFLMAFLMFLIPGILSAEAYSFLLPDYPRKWGYFLSLVNQFIIFLFASLIAFSDNFGEAWSIIWLGLSTLYASNFFVLVLSNGPGLMKRISVLSFIQPVLILSGFHIVLGRFLQLSLTSYLTNMLVIVATGLVLALAFYLTEFLVGSNIPEVSIFSLATALLQNRQEKLDLGRTVKPDVQTLEIRNSSGLKRFIVPWLHPGPIQGFGGGKISKNIIDSVNNEYEGFFLHVPSCHQMDPADPRDAEKIMEASSEVDSKNKKASRLIRESYGICTFYGRLIGQQKVVFMDIDGFDDFDSAIFQEIIDKEEVLLIDLHNNSKKAHEEEMRYGTVQSEQARKDLLRFIDKLEKQEQHIYSAGYAVKTSERPLMALVEDVDNQKSLLLGLDGNDLSKELKQLRKELEKGFDEVLIFTTDSHSSLHDLASREQAKSEDFKRLIEEASKDVSEASIGLNVEESENMRFLSDDYFGLIYSINILVRLVPMALLFLYILLVVWII